MKSYNYILLVFSIMCTFSSDPWESWSWADGDETGSDSSYEDTANSSDE